MKYPILYLLLTGMMAASTAFAEGTAKDPAAADTSPATTENSDSAVAGLCDTYAEEDHIADDKKAAYLKDCMNSMTDLSEGMQETVPLVADETDQPVAAPSSEKVNQDPDQLVKSELVETPDPTAEQLETGKNP
jgi:hypothetical protein